MTHFESQGQKASGKRIPAPLTSKLEKNLWAYAAAATAAGVGMLAGPQTAEAKIVYTTANVTMHKGFGYALDLNHDGIVDFNLIPWGEASVGGSLQMSYLNVCHNVQNNNLSHQCNSSTFNANADNVVLASGNDAAALQPGATIGSSQAFVGTGVRVYMGGRDFYSGSNTAQKWNGPWVNGGEGVKNRYLGLKFKIDGEFHYGWARLTVITTRHQGFVTFLTAYAYETTANKSIVAGQIHGAEEASVTTPAAPIVPANPAYRPASLGLLGLGASGLSIWRRQEDSLN
jgi:hypothetical protein